MAAIGIIVLLWAGLATGQPNESVAILNVAGLRVDAELLEGRIDVVVLSRFLSGRLIVTPALILLLAAVPTAFLWRPRRTAANGHCVSCGYNLTGLPGRRCPECGYWFDPLQSTDGRRGGGDVGRTEQLA